MNCKLARIANPREVGESPRKYIDCIPATDDPRVLTAWAVSAPDNAAYVVIDGDTMLAKFVVFEGEVFEPSALAQSPR
jgi:hypothetical protein